ncbi:MAG: uroporphyrinogen decarboxylase family protein [Methanomassiliicoccales archaeon]
MTEMTSRQRVEATLAGEMPDRVPVVLFFQTAAQHNMLRDDVTWKELLSNPVKLCRNVRRQHFQYEADNLFLPPDFRSGGEAFGSRCEYIMKSGNGMRMPIVTEFALDDASRIDDLEVPDPSAGRGRIILDSISMLHRECGREVPIIGFLNSPADTATDILSGGYSSILPMMATDKEALHRLLSKINEYNIGMGKAMLDAGADALATVNGGFNDLTLGLSDYREFITPYHAQAVRSLPAPYCLHQCQNATPFLEEMASTGCAALSFHEMVDLAEAKRRYGGKHVLAGNVAVSMGDSVMSVGTPAQVEEAGIQAIAAAGKDGRFWLSGGCEIHHGIPEENIKALASASRKASSYRPEVRG